MKTLKSNQGQSIIEVVVALSLVVLVKRRRLPLIRPEKLNENFKI